MSTATQAINRYTVAGWIDAINEYEELLFDLTLCETPIPDETCLGAYRAVAEDAIKHAPDLERLRDQLRALEESLT